jgi:DNA-binding transcriptional MerR regulator
VALDMDRFCKVLALAGSGSDGEALAALRRARAMLADGGLSFTDIAARLNRSNDKQNAADKARADLASLIWEYSQKDKTVRGLQQRIAELQAALARKERELDGVRRELAELSEARRRDRQQAAADAFRPLDPAPPQPGAAEADHRPASRRPARGRRGARQKPIPGQLELAL